MLLLVVVDCEVASGDWHDLKVVVWCMGAVGCPVAVSYTHLRAHETDS